MRYRRAMTVAGSDSGGGAGVQADLKTFSALGCFGTSVITALTAQNTEAVTAIHDLPADFVAAQIDAVLGDIGTDAVKIGMLSRAEIVAVVAERLRAHDAPNVVLDPVMVAKSGDHLLRVDAVDELKRTLVPLAHVLTPNIPEAEVLTGGRIGSEADMQAAASELLAEGPRAVLLKGGHLEGAESNDLLLTAEGSTWLPGKRVETRNTHGTGCTLGSAIAAWLARGATPAEAVERGKRYVANAIVAGAGYTLGNGHGPVHHFHALWSEDPA